MPSSLDNEATTPATVNPMIMRTRPTLEPLIRKHGLMDGAKIYDQQMQQWFTELQTSLGDFLNANKSSSGSA